MRCSQRITGDEGMGVLVTNPHPRHARWYEGGGAVLLRDRRGTWGWCAKARAPASARWAGTPFPPPPTLPTPRVPEITPVPRHPPLLHILALGTTLGGVHTRRAFPSTPPPPHSPPQAVRPKHREPGTKTQAGWDTCLLGVRGSLAWGLQRHRPTPWRSSSRPLDKGAVGGRTGK